jgi:peptide/nickel transport system substrate-binding protein
MPFIALSILISIFALIGMSKLYKTTAATPSPVPPAGPGRPTRFSTLPLFEAGEEGDLDTTTAITAAIPIEPVGLDPAINYDNHEWLVASQIYDSLTAYQPGNSLLAPGLAVTWTVSTDGLTWTFDLRQGAKFQDGTNADASAVVFNIERWWDPAHPNHNGSFDYFAAIFGGFKEEPNSLISDTWSVGNEQVFIELTRPYSPLPDVLAMPAFAIASPAAIQAGTLANHPVGSGPFQFAAWSPSDQISLEANPTYWGEAPAIQDLIFQIIGNETDRLTALENGAVQAAYGISDESAEAEAAFPGIKVLWRPTSSIGYLGINRGHTPLDNDLVRQAIAHAIDREYVLNNFYSPGDQRADQLVPPSVWGHVDGMADYQYDPPFAQDLLAQAGYTSGFSTTLAYRDVYRAYLPDPAGTAQAIAAYLGAVGIDVQVIEYEPGEMIDKVTNGELDLYLLGWSMDYPHPDNFLNAVVCGLGAGFGPRDDVLCNSLGEALAEPSLNNQATIYRSASARVHETLPLLPLRWAQTALLLRADLSGIIPSPLGFESYQNAKFDSAFQVALSNGMDTLDPAISMDSNSWLVASQIYERLTTYDPGSSKVEPSLAMTWTTSSDNLTWTFTLRPGVKFQDGSDLDAAAVLFNLARWWDPDHPNHEVEFEYFRGLFGGYKGDPNSLITDLSTVGEDQVVIQLARPYSMLPSILGIAPFSIASPAAIQAGSLELHPVGSGPFRFGYYSPSSVIALQANLQYWNGAPSLQQLEFWVMTNETVTLAALQAGDLHTAYNLSDDTALSLANDPSLQVHWRPANATGYLGMNRSHTPLDNILVRQAIAHAINRQNILNSFYSPGDLQANQLLPPAIWGHDPSLDDYEYNPALALDLLSQAGYSGGFNTTLTYRDVPRIYLPDPDSTAQAIAADLEAVGIHAQVVEYESNLFLDKFYNGELDLFLLGWTFDYPHPHNFYYDALFGPSEAGFGPRDDVLFGLLEDAQTTDNPASQLSLYLQAGQRIHDTLPLLPIRWPQFPLVLRGDVTGVVLMPVTMDSYQDASIGGAAQAAMDPTSSSSLTYTSTQGVTTTVQIPAGAVSETTILRYTPVITPSAAPSNFLFAGNAFDLEAIQGGFAQEHFSFNTAFTVTIHYSDDDVARLDEMGIRLYYLDGASWRDSAETCSPPSIYIRNPAENWLNVAICHLSTFALFDEGYAIYLPVLQR